MSDELKSYFEYLNLHESIVAYRWECKYIHFITQPYYTGSY